jgi:hypothetical protein
MARTRARLVQLKDEPVAVILPSATPSDLGADGAKNIGDARDTTRDSSTDQIRTRLLNRLEEERRQIPQAATVLPDPARSAAEMHPGAGLDSQAAEAKLRMQAQVRVRLAAAKRVAGGYSAFSKDATVGTEGDAVVIQREESLRARLRERQI